MDFSLVVTHGLSCFEACGVLVPLPGTEPVSPEMKSGLLTAGPEVPKVGFRIECLE